MLGSDQLTVYVPLQSSDYDDSTIEKTEGYALQHRKRKCDNRIWFVVIGIFCLAVGLTGGIYISSPSRTRASSLSSQAGGSSLSLSTDGPPTRREWRSLSLSETEDYIQAVRCLSTTESTLGLNQTLYDDFPWVHSRIGGYSHGSAAFLAWHRYFIYVYEQTLKERCGYTGHLTYWDWTLDWEDITASPVWDPTTGFGGNGDPTKGVSIVHGHCIQNGPFADLEIPFIDSLYHPHCLSRGFTRGPDLHALGENFRPAAIEELLNVDDYDGFNIGLEDGPHISIPRSIRGDFALFTAPSDPVFFLHHTQLDRLWWKWQQGNPQQRLTEYTGKASHNSSNVATLEDIIPMGGLAPDIEVSSIMSTMGGLLCYKY